MCALIAQPKKPVYRDRIVSSGAFTGRTWLPLPLRVLRGRSSAPAHYIAHEFLGKDWLMSQRKARLGTQSRLCFFGIRQQDISHVAAKQVACLGKLTQGAHRRGKRIGNLSPGARSLLISAGKIGERCKSSSGL